MLLEFKQIFLFFYSFGAILPSITLECLHNLPRIKSVERMLDFRKPIFFNHFIWTVFQITFWKLGLDNTVLKILLCR